MRLKITTTKEPVHGSCVTCVGWSNTEEVFTAGDDNQMISWKVSTNEWTKMAQFKQDILPTDMQFMPRVGLSIGKHNDLILLTSADGRFYLINKTGRIERSIEGHKGAVLVGQWNNDGSGFMTGGEDGFIKIWSRSGMLRSTLVSGESSIYSACWSGDGQTVAYTQGQAILLKPLAANSNVHKWKAHEGLVLCLAWNATSDLILSGGEDCRYRVWDSLGRPIYSSGAHDNNITSVSWSPQGDLFVVGCFNTMRLCDYCGWSKSLEKPNSGCIYKLAWSNDGTQIAAACANGHVIFAHIVDRTVNYLNYKATITEKKTIVVKDLLNDTSDVLELSERAIHMCLRYSHLVVTTPSECYIYNTNNWNTPTIFELKDGSVTVLQMCEKHFLLIEKLTISLYNYYGKMIASPRWPNMKLDLIRDGQISISPDTLVVCNGTDGKMIYIIDLSSSRSMTDNSITVHHTTTITKISLDQAVFGTNRNLAILDKTKDLYLINVQSNQRVFKKLGSQIESFSWNSEDSMIAAVQDVKLLVWYCPMACFDRPLLKLCCFQYESPELGRSPRINDFVGNSVSIRRSDGSLINVPISPFPSLLHKFVQDNKWNEALNLCRSIDETPLWACLAGLACQTNNELLDVAEEAFAEIGQYDKVLFIQHVKELPTKAQHRAGAALLAGSVETAEAILLQNGMVYQAISNHILLHNWERALELAIKHKTHIDTVLYKRKKYLDQWEKEESNNAFLNLLGSVTIEEEKILTKIQMEEEKYKNTEA